MLQIFPFYSYGAEDNVQGAYEKANKFLAELSIIDVLVAPENIRTNTKTYPDFGTTATTVEVVVDMAESLAPHELADQIREMYHAVVDGEVEVEKKSEAAPAADAFDPFLDSDDMP
jgi:hypothetical protein